MGSSFIMCRKLLLLICFNQLATRIMLTAVQGQPVQNPIVSCQDDKRKLLCLPSEYSKFDLPYRNDFNVIDIGKQANTN